MVKNIVIILLLVGCGSAPTPRDVEKLDCYTMDSGPDGEATKGERNPTKDLACCLASYLDTAGIDTNFRLLPTPHLIKENEIILGEKGSTRRWRGPMVREWLSIVDTTRISAHSVNGVKGGYKVLLAPYHSPCGLAVNFTRWLVLKNNNQVVAEFQSLIDVPSAVFLRLGSQSFEILIAEFSPEFHAHRDYDNPSYELSIYSIEKLKTQERQAFISSCLCDA